MAVIDPTPYWCTYEEFLEHQVLLNEAMWSWQLGAVDHLDKHSRGLIRHDMRMGKTKSAIAFGIFKKRRRWLIQCSKNAMMVWCNSLMEKVPGMKREHIVIVDGTKKQREKQWRLKEGKIFICTYAGLQSDQNFGETDPFRFDYQINDEIHRSGARNRTTKGFAVLERYWKAIFHSVMTSGTPVSKVPQLWALLNLIDPKRFTSYWGFIHKYCIMEDNGFGQEIIGTKNERELHVILASYFHTALRSVHWAELPPKSREPILVDMTEQQKELNYQFLTDMVAELPDGRSIIAPNQVAALQRIRMLLCSPRALTSELGYGAGIEKVVELIGEHDLLKTVVFTPFAKATPEIKDRLQKEGFEVRVLQGGVSPYDVDQTEKWFKNTPKGIVICTIKFAQAFSLASAQIGFFLGMEWNHDDNEQAEDRLWAPENPDPHFFYLIHRNSVETQVVDVNDCKIRSLRWMNMTADELMKLADPTRK